jgi:hypothetical protein
MLVISYAYSPTGEYMFIRDTKEGTTQALVIDSNGKVAVSIAPSISGDGSFAAYESGATNLVSNDTNGYGDVFVSETGF